MNKQVIRVLRNNLKQALNRSQLAEAAKLLERLKQEQPLAVETRGLELEYLLHARQWPDALALAEQLLTLYPASARIHYLAGRIYYQRKDYKKAQRCFLESQHIHPHWLARRWLGKTYTQTGQFDEAESLLLELRPERDQVDLDLAWLFERTHQFERAIGCVAAYLEKHPDHAFAKRQQQRLKAQALTPDTLAADVDTLTELDEAIPDEMLPAYIQGLLETGHGADAREFVARQLDAISEPTAASMSWNCYRLQAYDLALTLFLHALPVKLNDVKFLSALETAARRCERTDDLIGHYEKHAEREKRLYGRIKSLRKRS